MHKKTTQIRLHLNGPSALYSSAGSRRSARNGVGSLRLASSRLEELYVLGSQADSQWRRRERPGHLVRLEGSAIVYGDLRGDGGQEAFVPVDNLFGKVNFVEVFIFESNGSCPMVYFGKNGRPLRCGRPHRRQ